MRSILNKILKKSPSSNQDGVFFEKITKILGFKPNTEIYLRCMIKAGVSPKETIILEDSELGRRGAKETGSRVLEIRDSADVTYRKIRKFIDNVK